MNRILLLGAGFSRNWGGPLASEMNGRLLGRRQMRELPALRQAFVSRIYNGGFEAALGHLQNNYAQNHSADNALMLQKGQEAIAEVFAEFDTALAQSSGIEFQQDIRYLIRTFLVKFDAIYTLNVDLLLERHYLNENIALGSNGRWNGGCLPGMRRLHDPVGGLPNPGRERWTVLPDDEYQVNDSVQPIYKLHGSVNWFDDQTQNVMVLGYDKQSAIQSQRILRRYHSEFEATLEKPDTRLMVIGYGFADEHINRVIKSRVDAGNLRMFIVDPLGVDVTDLNRNAAIRPYNPLLNIIDGYSTRPLRGTFGGDISEHMNLMNFIAG